MIIKDLCIINIMLMRWSRVLKLLEHGQWTTLYNVFSQASPFTSNKNLGLYLPKCFCVAPAWGKTCSFFWTNGVSQGSTFPRFFDDFFTLPHQTYDDGIYKHRKRGVRHKKIVKYTSDDYDKKRMSRRGRKQEAG